MWWWARQMAHSTSLPIHPAQSNKLGSSIIVLSQLKPTTIDTTVQHGMDGGMAIEPLAWMVATMWAREWRNYGEGLLDRAFNSAAAFRRARIPHWAWLHVVLTWQATPHHSAWLSHSPSFLPSPSSFLEAQAKPASRLTRFWLGLALIIGHDTKGIRTWAPTWQRWTTCAPWPSCPSRASLNFSCTVTYPTSHRPCSMCVHNTSLHPYLLVSSP